ncbi:EH domain-containing protein 3-like protein [Histomonas meleagridis]|uniref:EH domain-containing protein 3-like protein n=1 Tax=Histomonas meleagridis TaxID=135588 RepID=UPI0035599E56|nr:EH domain-containing protein 3-like protein [Histomonas meleagridis]KAH0797507.1 EH domain-containing protein 3-like protein [Histomonas meleagridis]
MDDETIGTLTLSKRESVLEEVASIYTHEKYGLLEISSLPSISKILKRKIFQPEKKVIVLIVGGHSTGKSSFVNWFFGDNIQKVSAAIETSKITFITTGRKRQTLDGNTTIKVFDFLEAYKDIPNFVENLQTEKRLPVKERSSLVTFIDTPGLIPDKSRLAYDSEQILLNLSRHANLIFVFNDPIGQAFSEPLLDFVEKSHIECRNKIHFFLSKSDSIDSNERNRIVASIAQTLTNKVSKVTIDVRPFHLPQKDLKKMKSNEDGIGDDDDLEDSNETSNSLDYICEIIEKAVDNTVQSNLSQLSNDLNAITRATEVAIIVMRKRKKFFIFSSVLTGIAIGYFFTAFNSRRIKFSSQLYLVLIVAVTVWIVSFALKPSATEMKKIEDFRDKVSKKTKIRLEQFYREIKND